MITSQDYVDRGIELEEYLGNVNMEAWFNIYENYLPKTASK